MNMDMDMKTEVDTNYLHFLISIQARVCALDEFMEIDKYNHIDKASVRAILGFSSPKDTLGDVERED